jgi:15-cis-phytoene synthase
LARDTNFYYSFLVLPAAKRNAIVAVWDFCRAVDDATDEPAAGSAGDVAAEVARWRGELAACFEGGTPRTPQGAALVPVIRGFDLSRAPFEALIDGVEMDLVPRRYENFGELYEYCIRVASAVGLMCIEIFGYRDAAAKRYATDLGVALQLTNILRDVRGDLERGRLYIPLEDLRGHGCTEEEIGREAAAGRLTSPAVRTVLRQQAERARDYYRRADRARPREASGLVAAEIMGAIYRALLDRIERRGYDVFAEVVRIPRPRRALIAATTWARMAMTRPGRSGA